MFCLRSWLPLLFIPTNASPIFIISFVALTYIIHRPCIYCSALLLILFASSCHWSDRCIFDLRSNWFAPRYSSELSANNTTLLSGNATVAAPFPGDSLTGFVFDTFNSTAKALASAAMESAQNRLGVESKPEEWTGVGLEWLRGALGRREWTLPCVDVKVRL
ncbi:hypothetical protein PENSTE_c005G03897 [Penicillium steckii]|uniref:Uncharacterized protein n=1 Tax=Penicillium steckii TaxID=303698 RepID=A0A1V6TLB7_9EURO|nr:hypothetical protein PENSTE_c005G03897 [Penicillium steckii]